MTRTARGKMAGTGRLSLFSLTREEIWLLSVASVVTGISTFLAYYFGLPYRGLPIRSDGFAYFSYLPAFFLDHDLTFVTRVRLMPRNVADWSGIRPYGNSGRYIDIYPIGVAVLQAPFFIVAEWVSRTFVI